jgi:hypothetical protein
LRILCGRLGLFVNLEAVGSVPMPSISTSTVLPGFIDPTPIEVPQRMTSPGSRVMSWEIMLTSCSTEKRMSLIG